MDINTAKIEIEALRDKIRYHSKLYYENDAPEISDYEYDSLIHNLEQLELQYPEYALPDSPTKQVGYTPSGKFEPVVFDRPMLSLGDIFNYDEVRNFCEKIYNMGIRPSFVCELKIDGIASSLTYKKGFFTLGSTRGDGSVGENITENLTENLTVNITDDAVNGSELAANETAVVDANNTNASSDIDEGDVLKKQTFIVSENETGQYKGMEPGTYVLYYTENDGPIKIDKVG